MALLNVKSFHNGETPDIAWTGGWLGINTAPTPEYVAGRRAGTWAIGFRGSANINHGVHYQMQAAKTEVTLGFARLQPSNRTFLENVATFTCITSAGSEIVYHVRVNSAGYLYGAGTASTGFSSIPMSMDTWNFVEFKYCCHATAGYLIVRLNGVEVLNFTGNTRANAGTYNPAAVIGARAVTASASSSEPPRVFIQDVYVCDNAGTAPFNSFLGDVAVDRSWMNGNGSSSDFVGQDGNSVDNYLNVIGDPNPVLTSYNESDLVGDRDFYQSSNLASGASDVMAVVVSGHGSKTTEGTATARLLAKSGASVALGAETGLGTGLTQFSPMVLTIKPGGGAWTAADFNAAEFGVEVVS